MATKNNTNQYYEEMRQKGFEADSQGNIYCLATLLGDPPARQHSRPARVVKQKGSWAIEVEVTRTDFEKASVQLRTRENNGWQSKVIKKGKPFDPPIVNSIKAWDTGKKPPTQWLP